MKGWRTLVVRNKDNVGSFLAGMIAISAAATKVVGEPWLFKRTKDVLSDLHRSAFRTLVDPTAKADDHRITLYRYYKWCFFPGRGWWPWCNGVHPWSGWLIPVARAGAKTAARTIYLAKDSGHAEGICGNVYFAHNSILEHHDLPNIDENATDAEIEEYAKKTFVTVETVRKRVRDKRSCARYFLSIRIQVEFTDWGILMIDSRAEDLPQKGIHGQRFIQLGKVLSRFLKGA
jgi:hypothetical protein